MRDKNKTNRMQYTGIRSVCECNELCLRASVSCVNCDVRRAAVGIVDRLD